MQPMKASEALQDFMDMYMMILHTFQPQTAARVRKIMSEGQRAVMANDETQSVNILKRLANVTMDIKPEFREFMPEAMKRDSPNPNEVNLELTRRTP